MPQLTIDWVCDKLERLLNLEATQELASYILSIDDRRNLEDYLNELLDSTNPEHAEFVETLLESKGTNSSKKTGKKVKETDRKPSGSSKKKYVPLFSADKVTQFPGRRKCNCEATKHPLISNCTSCGRIICTQEGSGPCLYCGSLVCTASERAILLQGTKDSEKLRDKLMKAMEHKEKLLEYDRTSAQRTQVIDDQNDYYNRWLSPEERKKVQEKEEKLRKKKHASRLQQKVTIDFAGRRVIEAPVDTADSSGECVQGVKFEDLDRFNFEADVHPSTGELRPIFQETDVIHVKNSQYSAENTALRVQDCELQEMSDTGMCLSIRQPWASLIMTGAKKHEGRSWYTMHRGKLWIASAAHSPTSSEITEAENAYKFTYGHDIQLPSDYPVGCLLGHVHVDECVGNEEYTERWGEAVDISAASSAFVLILSEPVSMPAKFPMSGRMKIFKLDKHVHAAALKSLGIRK